MKKLNIGTGLFFIFFLFFVFFLSRGRVGFLQSCLGVDSLAMSFLYHIYTVCLYPVSFLSSFLSSANFLTSFHILRFSSCPDFKYVCFVLFFSSAFSVALTIDVYFFLFCLATLTPYSILYLCLSSISSKTPFFYLSFFQ